MSGKSEHVAWLMMAQTTKNTWRQRLWVLAVLVALSHAASAGERESTPQIIPTPQLLSLESGALPVVAEGKSAMAVFVPENPDEKEALAGAWVAKEIAAVRGARPSIVTGPSESDADGERANTQLVLATYSRKTETLRNVIGLLDEGDKKLLSDPLRSEQAYVIRCGEHRIAVVGGSTQGTLYGAMTFLQLLRGDANNVNLPSVHIRDWPDVKYRVAENWTYTEGRAHWGRGWCYDWGDGVETYKKRVTAIFDRCLRYKINMICFSADFYGAASWDGDDFPLQKELNRLAADRGIKLMIGGLGIGCEGTGLLNRKSYPDGEEYLCLTTKTMGNCRSNDQLTTRVQERLRDYVQKTEPRALYIHQEDSDTYASAEWLWDHRCEDCKRRWPNEEMASANGAAGAFTHGYNAICDAVFGVKNADTGYDASRDCLVILVAPTYTAYFESDAVWDKQLQYWGTVSKLLKQKKNVCLGFREQFLRNDNNKKRILEMSQTIQPQGDGLGLFLFVVSPASLYRMGPLFSPVPAAMSKLNEGTDAAYYMCGRIFQEPLILLNASHMWNMDSLGALDVPKTASECRAVYREYERREADGIYGRGGFLELACRRLYGAKAGVKMEKLYEMKAQPLAYARELYIWGRRSGFYWDWKPELNATREAIAHVKAALEEPDCNEENRPILERFLKCLEAGRQFAEIRLRFQDLVLLADKESTTPEDVEKRAAIIEERMQTMEGYLKGTFTYDWATPLGGDIAIWNDHLADMRGVLSRSVKTWTDVICAHQVADREGANGGVSPLVNGDMESTGGWKFLRVTGEEEMGYADGGYVDDKASGGERSYRIIKREVDKISHKWPMPIRTTWGEIEQEINVQPGQEYVVAFDLFTNWDHTTSSGYVEYVAFVDDKIMWSLDGSVPRGWKKGGFFFTANAPRMRLTLRSTDVKPCGGWRATQGDSWWDSIKVYPVAKDR